MNLSAENFSRAVSFVQTRALPEFIEPLLKTEIGHQAEDRARQPGWHGVRMKMFGEAPKRSRQAELW